MLFFLLYQIGEFFALLLPLRLSYKIANFISDIKYLVSFVERREMLENLKLVLPNKDVKVLKYYSRQIFANFSKYLVDFFRFKKIDLRYIEEHIEIINKNYVDEALKNKKGAILLTAHLGNWELGGAIIGILGYPLNALAMEHKNKLVNDFFMRHRQMKNEKVIPINFAVRKCLECLANNELVGIVGDKDYTNHGVVVKFFGRDTLLPKGPALLNLKTGAAIIPGFLIRTPNDDFQLIFERPIEYSASGDFDRDVADLTRQCAQHMEEYIRRYPTQWYCFRRFWL